MTGAISYLDITEKHFPNGFLTLLIATSAHGDATKIYIYISALIGV